MMQEDQFHERGEDNENEPKTNKWISRQHLKVAINLEKVCQKLRCGEIASYKEKTNGLKLQRVV